MRAKRLVAGVLAGATTLTVAGGCAAKQIQAMEPKLELRNAAQQLADAERAGFTLKLTGSADDLIAAVGEGDTPSAADADADTVRRLFTSSFTIGYDKAGAGTEDDRSSLAATIGGVTGTEVRYVDGIMYAKAPVTELATTFGASPAEVKSLSDEAVGDVPGIDAFFAGKWVAVDVEKLTALATEVEPSADPQQEQAVKELTAAATNLLEGADVVRDSADDTHLIVTTSTTKAYAEAKRVAAAVDEDLAGKLTKAPADRPIVLDLWIADGKLTAAELNLLQFVDGATGRVAARLEVTTGAPIAAPEGATTIDPAASGAPRLGMTLGN